MLTLMQAVILGALQGVTELFPISSLGHSVIFPTLVGWHIDQNDPTFLTFIVATHLATALVLLIFFFDDWRRIVAGMLRSLRLREVRPDDTYARLGWLLVVSSVPVGILGILFEKQLSALFAVPLFAGIFLMGNGVLLYSAEALIRRRPHDETHSYARVARLPWAGAVKVGLMQCLALLPGFSRTGATLAGGLLVGFSHEDAARYAFLLATPIIFAAAVLKLPQLALSGESFSVAPFIAGALAAALGAYLSVRYLTRYFQTKTLTPFAYYCLGVGLVAVLVSVL
ncbi:MAG TPA: undecaprenyl-diphosphate phosphatase [Candidatus Paceibacterota bacterium]|nr:undecaprenyl-diphosphate phosphatase [Candidatus Paceibacterota bacterium]